MSKPQIIVAPNGEELVILPRADYEALVEAAADLDEDEADLAVYDLRKAEGAADAPRLPAQVSAAMLRGDSLLGALRKHLGLKQREVAARLGIGQGYLSDLEARRRKGSPETLAKLAEVYGVPVAWLSD
jgi:hypothetical protein